jgi:hypothetical protein
MPERPCVVIVDFESTFIPIGLHNHIHNQVPNSTSFFCMCTCDDTIIKVYEFIDDDCVEQISFTLKEINNVLKTLDTRQTWK